MKRQDIISKLMNEGFSQKTLVNLNDKQLNMLSERILSEQYALTTTTTGTQPGISKGVKMVPAEKAKDSMNKRETFMTYEGEVKEELKGTPKKKDKTEKEITLQRIHHKIETKMKKGECIKTEVELLKRMKEDVPERLEKYIKSKGKKLEKEMAEQSAKVTKLPEEPAQKPTTKPISDVPVVDGGNKKVSKWVNKIVENKVFTSKNEIINLIHTKLNEQHFEDEDTLTIPKAGHPQKETEVEPDIAPSKPKTDPGHQPDHDDPFRDPHPDIKPGPKAKNKHEISATAAKNKIMDVIKKML